MSTFYTSGEKVKKNVKIIHKWLQA